MIAPTPPLPAEAPQAPGRATGERDGARARFLDALRAAVLGGDWRQLLLTRPRRTADGPTRVSVRPLLLRGEAVMCFVSRFPTRETTRNLPLVAGLAEVGALLEGPFRSAHLETEAQALQLTLGKRGDGHLARHGRPATAEAEAIDRAPAAHDRAKHRPLAPDRPFLAALGVTTAQGTVVPAMARKWKQINRFVEIVGAALAASPLAARKDLRVVDFGAGRGYLTFALHDWLRSGPAPQAEVSGVELRTELVAEGEATIARLGLSGLRMVQGEIGRFPLPAVDVMIALHACDTATDDALHAAVKAGAQLIVSSPCCHKQLRGQLLSPHPLRPVFRHGIHAEQQAEMLTDSLRALLLEAEGYDTQVFEFIALEHTRKNKMILASRRAHPSPEAMAAARRQVEELKAFFGIREQRLQQLFAADAAPAGAP